MNEDIAWEYCNPLIIIEAVIIFILFSKLIIGVNIIINESAQAFFSVYLLHNWFLPYVGAKKYVQGNIFVLGAIF